MWKLFKQDAQRWVVPQQVSDPKLITPLMILKLLWRYIPLRAMLIYRLGAWGHKNRIPLLPGLAYRFNYKRYGLEIPNYNNIKGGLYIAHVAGTVLMPESIGENCTVVGGVTIGLRNGYAFPRLGDNVFLGAGARVLGDIDVGDNATIGANAVVIKDVPAARTAVGIPAKVLKAKEAIKPIAEPVNEPDILPVHNPKSAPQAIPKLVPIPAVIANGKNNTVEDPFTAEFLELHDILMASDNSPERRPVA